jgi:ribosomal protein S18 acetylase RimI-like enzyme
VSPTGVRVRRAVPADVSRLKELGVLGWETTYHTFVQPENRRAYHAGAFWSLATLERVVRDPRCVTLVSEEDTAVISGFLTVEPAARDQVELTRFYVDSARRGAGIGATLFAAALDLVRVHATVMLVNVIADNHSARAFYERAGCRLTRLEPTLVGDQQVGDAWYELVLRDVGCGEVRSRR